MQGCRLELQTSGSAWPSGMEPGAVVARRGEIGVLPAVPAAHNEMGDQ